MFPRPERASASLGAPERAPPVHPDPDAPRGLNQKQTVEPPRRVQTSNLGKTSPECIFLIFSDLPPPRARSSPSAYQVLTKPADGKAKDGKVEEIPIPEIRKVTTYEQDYRPNFSLPVTYLRSRTFGAPLGDAVEYDLDNDDEDWLEKYNDGQNRLPAEKFEVMIWKLEVSCGEANDAQMAITAAAATERGQIISYQDKCAAMAGTDALPKEKALELLKEVSGRPAILEAVYVYWCEKRKRTGKPCLRRLQPPPAPNDANPFNVFRQREKTNRPQTRRRRENDAPSFEKMRQIRRNVEMAYAIVELQLRREEKKLERARSECDAQALQIKLRHEPRTVHEEIEAEYAKKPSARALSPKELEWDPSRTVTLPMSQVEVEMRPDGTYGLGGERFAPPPRPGRRAREQAREQEAPARRADGDAHGGQGVRRSPGSVHVHGTRRDGWVRARSRPRGAPSARTRQTSEQAAGAGGAAAAVPAAAGDSRHRDDLCRHAGSGQAAGFRPPARHPQAALPTSHRARRTRRVRPQGSNHATAVFRSRRRRRGTPHGRRRTRRERTNPDREHSGVRRRRRRAVETEDDEDDEDDGRH